MKDLISLDDIAWILRLTPQQAHTLVEEHRLIVIVEKKGKPHITQKDFDTLAFSESVTQAKLKALRRVAIRRTLDERGENKAFTQKTLQLLAEYRGHISRLEEIHRSYADSVNIISEESAVVAAYSLFARIIALLKMGCLCLENGFVETTILLRPIDEAINLAEYFMLIENTDEGKQRLRKWFRKNESPKHSVVRDAIANDPRRLAVSDDYQEHLNDLYQKKSKFIHHTAISTFDAYKVRLGKDGVEGVGFDYGVCSNPRTLFEVTDFFRSSIWTTVQCFLLCFMNRLPLKQEHMDELTALDRAFKAIP